MLFCNNNNSLTAMRRLLPLHNHGNSNNNGTGLHNNDNCSIDDCLRHFTKSELIHHMECRHCSDAPWPTNNTKKSDNSSNASDNNITEDGDECVSSEDNEMDLGSSSRPVSRPLGWKQLKISRLPFILCLHLSRKVPSHVISGSSGGMPQSVFRIVKVNTHVAFDTELNLSEFCESAANSTSLVHSTGASGPIAADESPRDLADAPHLKSDGTFGSIAAADGKDSDSESKHYNIARYVLKAVIVHIGSADAGLWGGDWQV
jgi:Ubiquitin carboxyl-terminal hydrolase